MKFVFLVCIVIGLFTNAVAQELLDASGSSVNCFAVPKQDSIPVVGYVIRDCFLYVPQLRLADGLVKSSFADGKFWVMRENEHRMVVIAHRNAISSMTMDQCLDELVDFHKKVFGACEVGKIDRSVGNREAVVDVEELATAEGRFRVVHKILRTVDGFAIVSVMDEAKLWNEYAATMKALLSSCRLATDQEIRMSESREYVCRDAEGDYFQVVPRHLDYKKKAWTSARDYFLKPEKNLTAESVLPKKTSDLVDLHIQELFGEKIGEELSDVSRAKRTNDKKFVKRDVRKFKSPFDVFKNISIYYTPGGMLSYKIVLESNEYRDPDFAKMNARLKDVATAIEAKFSDRLKMVKTADGFCSSFSFASNQEIRVVRKDRTEVKSDGLVRILYSKFQLVFVDRRIGEKEGVVD